MADEIKKMIRSSIEKDQNAITELVFYQIEKLDILFTEGVIKEKVDTDQKAKIMQSCLSMNFDRDALVPFCIVPSLKCGFEDSFSFLIECVLNQKFSTDESGETDTYVPVSRDDFFLLQNIYAPKFANMSLKQARNSLHLYKNLPLTIEEFFSLRYLFGGHINMFGLTPFFESWRPIEGFGRQNFIVQYLTLRLEKSEIHMSWIDHFVFNESIQMFFRTRVNI